MRSAWFSHERGPRMGYHKFGPGPGGRGREVFIHAWRGGGRARRGDIKFLILEVLADGPRHGYDIITELENKSNGRYRPSAGSVYPTLTMLEEGGYITGSAADGKRVFTITDAGRELLTQKPGGATPDADSATRCRTPWHARRGHNHRRYDQKVRLPSRGGPPHQSSILSLAGREPAPSGTPQG